MIEDIIDIKTIQIKGEMLFSETKGKPKDHYKMLEHIYTDGLVIYKIVQNKFSHYCIRTMKIIKIIIILFQTFLEASKSSHTKLI